MKKMFLLLSLALCAGLPSRAEPFPADKLKGVWRMSQTYISESETPGTGVVVEMENRLAITLAFLGDGKCRMTASQTIAGTMTAVMPFIYKYEYADGILAFTETPRLKRGKVPMEQSVPCLNAARFRLAKKDDDSFVLTYADLSPFDRFYSFLGTQTSKYLDDGKLEVRKVRNVSKNLDLVTTEIRPSMVFRRTMGITAESAAREDSPLYKVLACQQDAENIFSYRFKLELVDRHSNKLDMFRMVQREFRTAVLEDSAQSYEGDACSLFVELPEFRLSGDRIEGRAIVLPMSVQTLAYDPVTRQGRMSVSLGAKQFDVARRYVRKNIESLALDSNIVALEGERPPQGRFYIGRETVKDGSVLEVEFKTE